MGKVTPERGFSSFKFVPGSQDQLILALKSVEEAATGKQVSQSLSQCVRPCVRWSRGGSVSQLRACVRWSMGEPREEKRALLGRSGRCGESSVC